MTTVDDRRFGQLVDLVRASLPDWESFLDPRLVKSELGYKREASSLAQQQLSKQELNALLGAEQYDEFLRQFERVGHATNLLWTRVPRSGDLGILYVDGLPKAEVCRALLDLLHGEGESPERLESFIEVVQRAGLTVKWTFPTYFLFLTHPQADLFVKPKVMKWFLEQLEGEEAQLGAVSGASYRRVLALANALRGKLELYGAKDMIDVQSFIWMCWCARSRGAARIIQGDQLRELLQEFDEDYAATEAGRTHVEMYEKSRSSARAGLEELRNAQSEPMLTELTLLKLLPHQDTQANKERGAWISVAPALAGDVRTKFEGAGWVAPDDWPGVAEALRSLVFGVLDDPDSLAERCAEFAKGPYSKGMQAGTISPILNALAPDQFAVINSKTSAVLSFFTDKKVGTSISGYPEANTVALQVAERIEREADLTAAGEMLPVDLLDMFSHWIVAVKKPDLGQCKYWKIAPGENARLWDQWREGSYIAIGWDELGDISGLTRAQFDERCREVLREHPEWNKSGLDQVWTFAKQMREGDRVVVNEGTKKVLALGRVTGPYYYVPDAEYGHRLPVEWDDLSPRTVVQGGWRKALVKLNRETFERIERENGASEHVPTPLSDAFASRSEAEAAFDVLRQVADALGIDGPEDPRISVTLRKSGDGVLRLNFLSCLVISFERRTEEGPLLLIALDSEELGDDELVRKHPNPFRASPEEPSSVYLYWVPLQVFMERGGVRWEPFEGALEYFRNRFVNWQKSPFHDRAHKPEVARAVFDKEHRRVFLNRNVGNGEDVEPKPDYSLEECAVETGFDAEELNRWVRAIERKGQAIIYGPPGTGKTHIAEKLAQYLIGGGDGFSELVQFHPAYAYEEFVQGIRPQTGDGGQLEYPMRSGRFLEFCDRARRCQDKCVMIIDEINRANLARVFGELMYLLEYRDQVVPLAGGGRFSIPPNVRIIGTMNTADRSIALVDHALRRRFAFIALRPKYDILRRFHAGNNFDPEGLIRVLHELNAQIADPDYEVGITFFLKRDVHDHISDIWQMEIEPYLEEYFFDQPDKVRQFRWDNVAGRILGG